MENGHNQSENVFLHLVFMFEMAAMQGMGKIANPVTGKVERSLEQAKFSIDLLGMLEEKTKGNLADGESRVLSNILYTLRMNFLDEAEKDKAQPKETGKETDEDAKPPSQ